MSIKTGLLLVLVIAGAVLVYSVAARISDQTLDVLVGLSCGVAATVPATIGLFLAVFRRRKDRQEAEEQTDDYNQHGRSIEPYPPRQPYPPVIVVTPQQNQFPNSYGGMLPPSYNLNEPPRGRDFKIIGEDDDSFDA
jgi:hypothetical protein